jgi:hypothetical protein
MQNWKPFYCFCLVDIQSVEYVMSETVIGQIDMVQFKNMFEIIKEKIGEKYLFVHHKFSAVICPGGASTWFAKVISFWHLV